MKLLIPTGEEFIYLSWGGEADRQRKQGACRHAAGCQTLLLARALYPFYGKPSRQVQRKWATGIWDLACTGYAAAIGSNLFLEGNLFAS